MEQEEYSYRHLLDDFCRRTSLASIEDREAFYKKADVTVDGIDFSLMPGGEGHPDALLLFCDFGPVPAEREALIMRRLLEANIVMMGVGRPSFGINYTTGHVLLSGAVPIRDVDGELLLEMLRHYAEKAAMWRENQFLLDQERQSLSLSDPDRNRAMRLFKSGQKNF